MQALRSTFDGLNHNRSIQFIGFDGRDQFNGASSCGFQLKGRVFLQKVLNDAGQQAGLHAFNDAQAYRAIDLYGVTSAKLLNLLHGQLHDTGHFVCKRHGLDLQTRAIKKRLSEKNLHLLHLHADRTGCEVHFVCGTT